MLIATLPPIQRENLIKEIMECPVVDAVRYNTGASSPFSPKETLERLRDLAVSNSKRLWIDLKGRQLRIVHWADPNYGKIVLNHEIEVDGPATIFFRGNETSQLKFVRGKQIFVDPPPPRAVGQGQAINILGDVKIRGYLTQDDCEYLHVGGDLGLTDFCLSFVENWQDVYDAQDAFAKNPNAECLSPKFWLKVESPKGYDFVCSIPQEQYRDYGLIAARDDWFITIGKDKSRILQMLANLVPICYPDVVLASRLFSGLEAGGEPTLADFADLELMRWFGYRHFMFSDGLCRNCFAKAIEAWEESQKTTRFKEGGLI